MQFNRLKTMGVATLREFVRNERGTAVAEFVIVFPLLVWAWLAMYSYWDAYRAINLSQKASFTVADTLSRQGDIVTKSYIDGMEQLMSVLAWARDDNTRMRVSSIGWDNVNKKHTLSWSYSPGSTKQPLTAANLVALKDKIPTLTEFETVLIVETWIDYTPPLGLSSLAGVSLGLGPKTVQEFVVIRPRFIRKMCVSGSVCA